MQELYEIQRVILEQFDLDAFYHRELFNQISLDNAVTGILGSRGIGKTTYLLYQVITHTKENAASALYVSADNPFFLKNSLLDVADYVYKQTDTTLLCIDEIHKYPNWEQEIKNIADIYKKIKVIFTGSSMIDIIHSQFDLSRRVTLHYFGGFSFREYLEFYLNKKCAKVTFEDLLKNHRKLSDEIQLPQVLKHFKTYLQQGYYLFFKNLTLEYDRFQAIENIAQKTIYEDIAVLHNVKTSSLRYIEQAYKFILNSAPGELNANKLANLLGKSFDQVVEYLTWLEQAGLVSSVYYNKEGKAFIKTPQNVFPENTNLLFSAYLPQSQKNMVGKLRETFFINQFKNAKQKIFYSKTGDFESNNVVFEIGGKNKSDHQIKAAKQGYVVADDIVVGDKNTIPLWLFGFLY